MRLLVSVRDAREAAAALAGRADVVDAKEPAAGALGAVTADTLRAIVRTVDGTRPVTAALGDAADEAEVSRMAETFVQAGADLIKVGLAGIEDGARARLLLASAARVAGRARVIAVAYADYGWARSLSPEAVLHLAIEGRVAGILLDTADKRGAGLPALMPLPVLVDWVAAGQRGGLLTALAGKLTAEDVTVLRGTGADIIGVRGAACDGGRAGRLSADRVSLLHSLLRGLTPVSPPSGV